MGIALMLASLLVLPSGLSGSAGAEGTYHILDFGAVGDGRTDDTPAFRRALEVMGDDEATLRITRGRYPVDGVTFPDNITLSFRNGGMLAVPEGGAVVINGAVEAGITAIFMGAGTVRGRILTRHVYPQWFGARGNGEQDDAQALQKAADLAAGSVGRTLFIPRGEYMFGDDVVFRSNVENRGLLVKRIEIDEEQTTFDYDIFLPMHHPKSDPHLRFAPDHEAVELDASYFDGIREGQRKVPVHRDIPQADGSGHTDLEEGGTLRFYSSDFFTSRRVRKGAHYYDRNDITQLVSGRGDVFPEFAFDYDQRPAAEPWSADRQYDKGDYVTHGGGLFKATWASGVGSRYVHRHLGPVELGPVRPRPELATTVSAFAYGDGTEDTIRIWRRVVTRVWYREKDAALTVNGLRVEVRLVGHDGEVKRIRAGAVQVTRSNMTFNDLEITVRDPEATLARLLVSSNAVNVEYNNGYISGATSAHFGYNILNSNVANIRYNDCISTNSRKGMDGRHAKNITVQGGFYNVIEDHYGRNFTVRDVVLSGLSVFVPGDGTPEADLQRWEFRPHRSLGLSGANLHVENATIDRAAGGIFGVRTDVGDLYGTIVLKHITVRRNDGDVHLFDHSIDPEFDYSHEVRVPHYLVVEDITLENPGRLHMDIGRGFDGGRYGPVHVRNSSPIGRVFSTSPSTNFWNSAFEDAEFLIPDGGRVNIRNSTFSGENTGLHEDDIGIATGNARLKAATVSFPIEHLNEEWVRPR